MKTYPIFSAIILAILCFACSDDDLPLNATMGSVSYDTVNTCGNSAPYLTEFFFEIELDSDPGSDVEAVEFDIEWSDGDVAEDRYEDDLIITGSIIEFDWCFRFGSTDWVEIYATILDENDNALSNEVRIRADKPPGAN